MPAYVALLRGINVGPRKRIAMAELRRLVSELGHTNVSTYVNSGNVVFDSESTDTVAIAADLEAALAETIGQPVAVVVRSAAEMAATVANNPFPERVPEPATLHVSFLSATPDPALVNALRVVEKGEDDYRVVDQDIYLSYPNGMSGAVFMVNGFDRALAVTSTSRNWRTVTTLAAMARDRS